MTGRGRRHLLPRPTEADRGVMTLVAVLSLLIVVGTSVAAGWLRTTADAMAAAVFEEASYPARQVQVLFAEVRDDRVADDAADRLEEALPPDLAALVRPPRHAVATTEAVMEALPKQPRYSPSFLSVVAVPGARDLVDVVEGRYPRPGTREVVLPRRLAATYDGPRRVPVVEVALERSAAEAMDVGVGTYLDLVPRRYSRDAPEVLTVPRVSGLFETRPSGRSALDDVLNLSRPAISVLPELSVVRAAALASDEETVLQAPWATEPEVRWTFDPQGLPTADRASAVVDDVRLLSVQPWPAVHDSAAGTAVTGIGDLAGSFLEQRRASDTVAALVLAALAAAASTLLLAAGAVLESRRRDVAGVLRARGAGTGRLALLRGGEAALVVAPGLVVVAVLLLWGPVTSADVVLALVAAAACPSLLTLAQLAPWRELPERFRAPARDAAQATTVLVAAGLGGALLVGDRPDATDPLLLVLPALVGAAGAVLVVRGLRLLTTLLRRVTARGDRVTPLVGISQAATTAQRVTLPVAAVVLGLSSALLATGVADSLHRGADREAWSRVGADVRVDEGLFGQQVIDRLEGLPGVEEVAPVYGVEALLHTATGRKPVRVLAVDPDSFAALTARAGQQVRVPSATRGSVGALASTDLELLEAQTTLEYAQADVPLDVRGTVAGVAGVTGEESFVLVDVAAFRSMAGRGVSRAEKVMLAGQPAAAAVADVAGSAWPTARVTSRDRVAAAVLREPAASRTLAVARASGIGSAVIAVLAAALALALGAPVRRRTAEVLHALGAGPRQVRRVGMLEALPSMVGAVAVAAVAGALLMAVAGRGGPSALPSATSWLLAGALAMLGVVALAVAARTRAASEAAVDDPGFTDEGGTR